MACVTLKRTFHELNNLEPSPKRRRCGGPASAPSTPPEIMAQPHSSSCSTFLFSKGTSKVNSEQLTLSVHQEWKRTVRRRKLLSSQDGQMSPMRGERMRGERKLSPSSSPSLPFAASSASASVTSPSSFSGSTAARQSRSKDQPLFTLKEVTMIVERLWKEREEELREEYERVLSDRLAEQYDAFVRFNQDQIQRRFAGGDISYVS